MKWSRDYIEKLESSGKIRGFKVIEKQLPEQKKKKAKYSNNKVEYDGKIFDSKKEYQRYRKLLIFLKAGAIGQLQLQVPYELNEGGTHSLKYVADFVYVDALTGETVVEDTKGFKTREYLKKKRLMFKVYKIKIKET